MAKSEKQRKLHVLDSLSVSRLPREMLATSFSVGKKDQVELDLESMLMLGDRCEDPFEVLHALDELPAMKAFIGTQLAHAEEQVATRSEAVKIVEGEAMLAVRAAMKLKKEGKEPTKDQVEAGFAATAKKMAIARSSEVADISLEIASEYGDVVRVFAIDYRNAWLRLRKAAQKRDLLKVVADALSSRSFVMTKMADLLGDMMHFGLVDIKEIVPERLRSGDQRKAERVARDRRRERE